MIGFWKFTTAIPVIVTCAGIAAAQNVIVIPDNLDRSFVIGPMQPDEGLRVFGPTGELTTDLESMDLQADLMLSPELLAGGKKGSVIVHAEKGKKVSKPIPACKGPISVEVNTGPPNTLGTVECGMAAAFCTVDKTTNRCPKVSIATNKNPQQSQTSGECTVVAGSTDGARVRCMYTMP